MRVLFENRKSSKSRGETNVRLKWKRRREASTMNCRFLFPEERACERRCQELSLELISAFTPLTSLPHPSNPHGSNERATRHAFLSPFSVLLLEYHWECGEEAEREEKTNERGKTNQEKWGTKGRNQDRS